jgi:plastocyanin
MKSNKVIVGAAIAVLIVLGIAIVSVRSSNNSKSKQPATTTPAQPTPAQTSPVGPAPASGTPAPSPSTPTPNPAATSSVTITYSADGFSPTSATVSSGGTVTVKNTSSGNMQFASDPHPQHTDDPELNAGLIAAGQSKTFTVTKKGTFGYHDHLNPSMIGTITIQ